MDAEGDAAHHRVGQAGLLAHVAGQVHQSVDHQRAQGQRGEDLRAAHAEGEEADGEGVVGDVVHVVGPQREQAVASPAAPFGLGRGEIGAVQARAQRRQFGAGVMAGAGQAIETGGSAQVQARRRELRCAQPGAWQAVETGRSAQVEQRGGELRAPLTGARQAVEAFQGAEVEQRGRKLAGRGGRLRGAGHGGLLRQSEELGARSGSSVVFVYKNFEYLSQLCANRFSIEFSALCGNRPFGGKPLKPLGKKLSLRSGKNFEPIHRLMRTDEGEGKKAGRQEAVLGKLCTIIVPSVTAAPVDGARREAQPVREISRPFNCPIIHAWASRPTCWTWL